MSLTAPLLFLEAVAFYNSSRLQLASGSLEVRITPLRIVTVTSLGQFEHIGPFQKEFEGFVDWWDPGKWLVSKRFSPLCPVDAKWMRSSKFSSPLAAWLYWLLTAGMSVVNAVSSLSRVCVVWWCWSAGVFRCLSEIEMFLLIWWCSSDLPGSWWSCSWWLTAFLISPCLQSDMLIWRWGCSYIQSTVIKSLTAAKW